MNLQSTVNTQGKYVTQILHFENDVKRTFHGIDTSTIKQGEFTKFKTKDGRLIMVHTKKILMIEVFSEDKKQVKAQ